MPSSFFKLNPFLFLLILTAGLSSCTKDRGIEETRLVITKFDRSIPTDGDVVGFDMYDENHLFAISYKTNGIKLFLSSNGGASWNDITDSFSDSWGNDHLTVQSVVYMDENNLALVTDRFLYRSFDGGNSWTKVSNGFQDTPIFCAVKTGESLLFIEGFTTVNSKVYQSSYGSSMKSVIGTIPPGEGAGEYDFGRLYGDYIVLLDYQEDYYYNRVHSFNIVTGEFEYLGISSNGYEYPVDAMRIGDRLFLIRKDGKLNLQSVEGATVDNSFYNYHEFDYYSGEYMGDYFIAVGEKTISTNFTGKWEEAINTDITGQKEIFRKVKKIDNDYFYIAGDKGLFFKGTFQ